ncbi:hypothetical protein [Halomarina oriensis]|uniref:Uncharacterized protein n=1 Tax=Halomarina oriensis TaxID=671145 RepID=A0A6B0GL46_9EURY|nr:hypothetical protein [Halomarina oriensis]MWG34601.1 hypothetical protein [Halomarina oriensis]
MTPTRPDEETPPPDAREATRAALGDHLRNRLALAVVTLAALVAFVIVPDVRLQYAAALVAFTVWMAWFVAAAVDWLSRADF